MDPSASSIGSAPFHASSSSEPRCSRSGPEMVPEAKRSPTRTDAPLTVRCASCWAADQYRWRALVRAMTVSLSSISRSRSSAHGSSRRYSSGAGSCAGAGDAAVEDRVERRDPRGHRGRERLGQERAQRAVLPRLEVARAPVVDQQHAEDVVERAVDGHRLAQGARHADDEAQLELDVEAHARAEDRRFVRRARGAGRWAGGSASRSPPRCRHARDSRAACGASWARAGRRRAGTDGRRSSRDRARSRSRRSRPPRWAAAARPRPAPPSRARRRAPRRATAAPRAPAPTSRARPP